MSYYEYFKKFIKLEKLSSPVKESEPLIFAKFPERYKMLVREKKRVIRKKSVTRERLFQKYPALKKL
jgi:hypothetical protein